MNAQRVAVVWMLGAFLFTSCGTPAPTVQAARRTIRLATGGPNGPFRTAGEKLAETYRKQLLEFDTRVVIAPQGGLDDIKMVQRGEAEVGFSYADLAYAAFVGKLRDQAVPFERLRAIALLQPAVVHVLAAPRSSVRHLVELRGRRADIGGAATLVSDSVLTAFGLKPDAIRVLPRPADNLAALLHGDLDALFILGVPPVPVVQTALSGGAHLVPIDGAAVDSLLHEYPFYSAMLVRPQTYGDLPAPVATIGINGVLLCRAELEEDLVYRLTKTLYEGAGESLVDPALAPWLDVNVGPATPVPLHTGAARYYRERELAR